MALVDEKQDLARQLRNLQDKLDHERKVSEQQAQRLMDRERRMADARSVLAYALNEYRKGARKSAKVADIRSALLALGLEGLGSEYDALIVDLST